MTSPPCIGSRLKFCEDCLLRDFSRDGRMKSGGDVLAHMTPIALLTLTFTITAADSGPLSKAELAVRAGQDVRKVNPSAARPGEFPFAYGSPGRAVGNPHGTNVPPTKPMVPPVKKGKT